MSIYVPDVTEVLVSVNHLRVRQHNLLKFESPDSNPEKCWCNLTQAAEVLQESNSSYMGVSTRRVRQGMFIVPVGTDIFLVVRSKCVARPYSGLIFTLQAWHPNSIIAEMIRVTQETQSLCREIFLRRCRHKLRVWMSSTCSTMYQES